MATRKKATKAPRKSRYQAVTRAVRKGPSLVFSRLSDMPRHVGTDRQTEHEERSEAVDEALAPAVPPREITRRDRERDHQQGAVQPVKLVMGTRPPGKQPDADQALDDEEKLGQHQRRPEAASGRLLAEEREEAPHGDEGGDQQAGSKQAIVEVEQGAVRHPLIIGWRNSGQPPPPPYTGSE